MERREIVIELIDDSNIDDKQLSIVYSLIVDLLTGNQLGIDYNVRRFKKTVKK